jgi:hypothetical protein
MIIRNRFFRILGCLFSLLVVIFSTVYPFDNGSSYYYLQQYILAQNAKINSVSNSQQEEQSFVNLFQNISIKANLLTHNYQVEVGKWDRRGYDNTTMAIITDKYLPKYRNLINETAILSDQAPVKYNDALHLYIKSLDSELQSYTHFRNYLLTGNRAENETSVQLLSDSLKYEMKSFAVFKAASLAPSDGKVDNETLTATKGI